MQALVLLLWRHFTEGKEKRTAVAARVTIYSKCSYPAICWPRSFQAPHPSIHPSIKRLHFTFAPFAISSVSLSLSLCLLLFPCWAYIVALRTRHPCSEKSRETPLWKSAGARADNRYPPKNKSRRIKHAVWKGILIEAFVIFWKGELPRACGERGEAAAPFVSADVLKEWHLLTLTLWKPEMA